MGSPLFTVIIYSSRGNARGVAKRRRQSGERVRDRFCVTGNLTQGRSRDLRSDSRPTDSTTSGASLLATRTRVRLPHPSRALRWCVSTVSVRMSRIRLPCRAHQSIALESQRYEHRRKKIRDDASKPFGTLVAKHVHRTGGGT